MDLQVAFNAYLAAIGGGSSLSVTTVDQQLVTNWISRYVPSTTITNRNLHHLVGVAHHAMEAAATQSISDIGMATIHDALVADPTRPVWASCSSSVEWMMFCLNAFGYSGQDTALWAGINNGHNIIEFWHPAFDKIVIYDPLYATIMLDQDGVPASLTQMVNKSPPSSSWDIQPFKLNGAASYGTLTCNTPAVQYYETYNYNTLINAYYQVVARRFQFFSSVGSPSLKFQDYVPGLTSIRGAWYIFDGYRGQDYASFWSWFWQLYAANGGSGTFICKKYSTTTVLNRLGGVGDIAGTRENRNVWELVDGTIRVNTASITQYDLSVKLASGWSILGVAEIDNDGTDDLVVISPAGEVHAWICRNGLFAGAGMIGRLPAGTDLSTVELKRGPFGPPALSYLEDGAVKRIPLSFGLFQ